MAHAKLYIETHTGKKISVADLGGCVFIIQTVDGEEIARSFAADFSMPKTIAQFHSNLMRQYGQIFKGSQINEITADAFSVSTSYVRDCVRAYLKSHRSEENRAA